MKVLMQYSLLLVLLLVVTACGSSDSDSDTTETKAKFSLGMSDAPVDDAVAVYIELDQIKLSKENEDGTSSETLVTTFTNSDDEVVETIQVNLLDFQGSAQEKIVDEAQNIELENGDYDMELTVVDAGSYVLLHDDATEHPIKVPSSRLRLGTFAVSDQAVQSGDSPAYTIEFDLRQSLVLRGNANNNNGFIIKPHGVRIVSLAGSIEGSVSADLTNLGQCVVYLYDENATEFGDMYDPNDETFVAPETSITASAPLATAVVSAEGQYEIGFVEAGNYQLALTCGTAIDDNIQYDALTIPDAADLTPDVVSVTVESQQSTTVNF